MISKIALGTVQFGLPYGLASGFIQVSEGSVKDIMKLAYLAGIETIDTATTYGNSDAVLGRTEQLSKFKVVTKLAPLSMFEGSFFDRIDMVEEHFRQSLVKLGVKSVGCLMVHHCKDLLEEDANVYIDFLNRLKAEGLTDQLGVSIYSSEEVNALLELPLTIDVIQLPASIADDRLERSGVLKSLKDRGIEIHARSIFLQGILLMGVNEIPESMMEIRNFVAGLNEACLSANISRLDACVAWGLNNPYIDKLVIGVNSVGNLNEIVDSVSLFNSDSFTLSDDLPRIPTKLLNPSNW